MTRQLQPGTEPGTSTEGGIEMTTEKSTASATKPRLQNNTEKDVQEAINATRTLSALLSIATVVAGILLLLTTHDATVRMLACCLVANESAKEEGR